MNMLRVSDIALPLDHDSDALKRAAAEELGVSVAAVTRCDVVRRSVDARMRGVVKFIYSVDVVLAEDTPVPEKTMQKRNVNLTPDNAYRFFIAAPRKPCVRPVIVGAGPCGLFGGLLLARLGLQPVILERGKAVRERLADVQRFWTQGALNPESNALFGEGGAGTFSDGKLSTQIKDREHRHPWIIRELVAAGAPPEIQYNYRPHIGTDKLMTVVERIRHAIIDLGGEIRFDACVTGLHIESGRLRGLVVNTSEYMRTDFVLLAVGHSARDTFAMLLDAGITMAQKAFSIGARIEHPQPLIDKVQYGPSAGHPRLGAAEYRAAYHCQNGRSVYTFCMCPGGVVINTANEPGGVVTNGMSCYARKGGNANSGLLVGVQPRDFADAHPLAGVAFQRRWEQAAYALAGGGFKAPVQRVGDLLAKRASRAFGDVAPTCTPAVTLADLRECLPDYVIEAWREAIPAIAGRIQGFDMPDALLTGVETRSSSPVRIERDLCGQSMSVRGLYPAGEGAGYAGGIISAAVDGMRAAEHIAQALCDAQVH